MGEEEAKTTDEQIAEMLDMSPAEPEEVTDELPDEEPVEELPAEEAVDEEVEEPAGEEVSDLAEEEVAEEGEVEEPEEEVGEEAAEGEEPVEEDSVGIEDYRQRVNKLAEAALKQGLTLPPDLLGIEEEEEGAPAKETPPVETPPAQEPPPMIPQNLEGFQILPDGMDLDDFLDRPENFVQGMRDILGRYRQVVTQEVLGNIPTVVNNQVRQAVALQNAVNTFYETNSDLKPVRPTVGAIAEQVTNKHPDWSLDKIMDESARVARKLLKMPSPKTGKKDKGTVVRPSFAKSKGPSQRNKPKPKKSNLQSQIDDLID